MRWRHRTEPEKQSFGEMLLRRTGRVSIAPGAVTSNIPLRPIAPSGSYGVISKITAWSVNVVSTAVESR